MKEKRDSTAEYLTRVEALLSRVKSYGIGRFDGWENKLYFGDNLGVLNLLLSDSNICGKVTLVYIDPPFATNQEFRLGADRTSTISWSKKDSTAYMDKLTGRRYLEYLRDRLILLKELLSERGSIYLHIDYKIGHYVKVMMDEVFGEERFINDITRIKCNPKNFERKAYGNIKDMILFYSKTADYIWNEEREELSEEDMEWLFPKVE